MATSASSSVKVVSSSCKYQLARSNQRHCVQYSISSRGERIAVIVPSVYNDGPLLSRRTLVFNTTHSFVMQSRL
jgi:hypothetical protein